MQYVKTLTGLAPKVGCARETLSRWKKIGDNFPKPTAKGYCVEECKKWILDNDKLSSNNADTPSSGKLYALKCRLAKQEIEKNDLDLKERHNELVDFEEVKALVAKCLNPIGRRLKDLPAIMGAKCNPADPSLAKEALREWVNETNNLIQKQCLKLNKQH